MADLLSDLVTVTLRGCLFLYEIHQTFNCLKIILHSRFYLAKVCTAMPTTKQNRSDKFVVGDSIYVARTLESEYFFRFGLNKLPTISHTHTNCFSY